MKYAFRAAVAFLLVTTMKGYAEVKPNALFTNHAVLQSNMPLPVWGTADPGEKISIRFGKRHASTTTDSRGFWRITLGKQPPGGPFVMTISGKNTVAVSDVLLGEDWIGAGQSNMAFTVSVKAARYAGMLD